jgi:hypothetical protein
VNAENFDLVAILKMAHSPIRNYAIPGLTSSLIGAPSPAGTVRLFQNARDHQEPIVPHSHRFDFMCWVLAGSVRNRVWTEAYYEDRAFDFYQSSKLIYGGKAGAYEQVAGDVARWRYKDAEYSKGECYSMKADGVHSIYFSRGAIVLFFEGPNISNESVVLEPVVDGETIKTFEIKPWMFRRERVTA